MELSNEYEFVKNLEAQYQVIIPNTLEVTFFIIF